MKFPLFSGLIQLLSVTFQQTSTGYQDSYDEYCDQTLYVFGVIAIITPDLTKKKSCGPFECHEMFTTKIHMLTTFTDISNHQEVQFEASKLVFCLYY